jgi:glycosyltransferase involved in cell wall biosynthesis
MLADGPSVFAKSKSVVQLIKLSDMCIPKVSVVIPSYNYGRFLDEAIQSVLNQTYSDFELIIIDDQSTDNTDEVVQKYLHDERVAYHKNEKNLGLGGNFNKCLEYANGEYIKFLLADDFFQPELLASFVEVMDQYPRVSLVTSYRQTIGAENKKFETPFSGLQDGKKIIFELLRRDKNFLGEPTMVMFRKSNLVHTGIFNTKYGWILDTDMWLKQLNVGDCYIIPEYLSRIRAHNNQASTSLASNFTHWFEGYEYYKEVKEQNELHVDLDLLEIDKKIRNRAKRVARVMYRINFHLTSRRSRSIFLKSLKIAIAERVVLSSFMEYLTTVLENF